jgi:hypothetical protein
LNAAKLLGIDMKQKRYRISDTDIEKAEIDIRPPVYGPVTRRDYLRLWARRGWAP